MLYKFISDTFSVGRTVTINMCCLFQDQNDSPFMHGAREPQVNKNITTACAFSMIPSQWLSVVNKSIPGS